MINTAAITNTANTMTDGEVVERVRAGDTDVFEVLMRRYNQRLYRVTRSILGDDAEAEDVTQDAYVRSYQHLDQFDGRAKFSTWLTRIAVHEALSRLRNRRRFVELDAAPVSMGKVINLESRSPSPEQEVLTHTMEMALEAATDRLPQNYRSVFILREVDGLSTAETAECLGISEEAVKVRLHRARTSLRKDIHAHTGAVTTEAFQFLGARCDRLVSAVLKELRSLAVNTSNLARPT